MGVEFNLLREELGFLVKVLGKKMGLGLKHWKIRVETEILVSGFLQRMQDQLKPETKGLYL